MMTQNRRLISIVLAVPFLLLIPFIANLFSDGEGWSLFDYILMGSLLLITGLVCEFVLRKVKKTEHRLAICGAILLGLLIIWAELAVGIFGSPVAGN
jgi:peptidoglycan/LPS O-acetylase OafA/YrhL